MPTTEYTRMNFACTETLSSSAWQDLTGYRVHLLVVKDEEGGYSAIALNLPGIGSCGSTEEEAVENAREAIRGALESYRDSGDAIPWKDTSNAEIPVGAGATEKRIIVNA
jgi:predicted RNase H-like HicB family nuclease